VTDVARFPERVERAWVRFIGRRRLSAFERALADPELVSLRQELVKVDGRIAELEERHQRGEPDRPTIATLRREVETALGWLSVDDGETIPTTLADRLGRARDRLTQMSMVLEQAGTDYALWDEVKDLLERRRRLADTERKFEELHKLMIPAAQFTLLMDDVHAALEAVLPRDAQLRLLQELRARLNAERRDERKLVRTTLPSSYLLEDGAAPAEDEADEPGAMELERDGS
jgi:hypothetical protein